MTEREFRLRMEASLVDFLDAEGVRRDRSRNWLISEAVRQWQVRLEGRRRRSAERAKRLLRQR